jgi:hypothetical protein
MRFLPHDDKFFEIFNKQIHLLLEVAGHLCSSATNRMPRSDAAPQICKREQQGNAALEQAVERLKQVFITTVDPEDLNALATNT